MGMTRAFAILPALLLLAAVPSSAAPGPRADVQDGGGETSLAAIDLRRLEVAADQDVVEVRLTLAADPAELERLETLATFASEYHYLYHVAFEVRPAEGEQVQAVRLEAQAGFVPNATLPCPCWAGVRWDFGLEVRPDALDAQDADAQVHEVDAAAEGPVLVWRLDRERLARDAGLLTPGSPWSISKLHAGSQFRGYVVDATAAWATGLRPGGAFGQDRAPDSGHGPTVGVPGMPPASSPEHAQTSPGATQVGTSGKVGLEGDAGPLAIDGAAGEPAVVGAGILTLAFALAALRPRPWLLALALFSRLAKADAMAHPRRALIVGTLRTGPATFVQLRRQLGMGSGALAHHLAVLERGGFVVSNRDGRHRIYAMASPSGAPTSTSASAPA